MSISIFQTVLNVMHNWPYDSYDAGVALYGKDKNGFIDCDELFYEDELDSIYDDEQLIKEKIANVLNHHNGLYLAIAFGESDEECD